MPGLAARSPAPGAAIPPARVPLAATGGVIIGALAMVNQTIPTAWQDRYYVTQTLIAGMVLVTLNAWLFFRAESVRPQGKLLVLAIGLLPGFFAASSGYSGTKAIGMAFGFILAASASQLLRDWRARRAMLVTIALIGTGTAIAVRVWGAGDLLTGRRTLADLSPIGVGFSCAVAAMLLFLAAVQPRTPLGRRLLLFGLTALCGLGAASTGSRGPLAAAVVAVTVTFLFSRARGRGARLLAAAGVVAASVALLRSSTSASAARLRDVSSSNRVDLWQSCLDAVWNGGLLQQLFGFGWGDMTEVVRLPMIFYVIAGDRQYEHNLFIEALVEGGLIALAALVWLVLSSWRTLIEAARDATGQGVLAVFTFAIAAACVSGDLAGNRLVWIMFGCTLAVDGSRRSGLEDGNLPRRGRRVDRRGGDVAQPNGDGIRGGHSR